MILNESGVRFDKDAHSYTLGGKRLRGITKWIDERLGFETPKFADTTLGTAVHKEIELFSKGIPTTTRHGKAYEEWLAQSGENVVASEYIVTDGNTFASSIDFVTGDGTLWDIKTYKEYDSDKRIKAAYQLNIYAYLFQLQNGESPKALKVLQVNEGGCEEHDVARLSDEEVRELLYGEGEFRGTLKRTDGCRAMDELAVIERKVAEMEDALADLKSDREAARQSVMREMERTKTTKWESAGLKVAYVAASKRTTLDAKRLQEEDPGTYARFARESEAKPSLRVKILSND